MSAIKSVIAEPKAAKKQIKIVTPATVAGIKAFLAQCEKYKNSYFWSGFGNQQQRTRKEKQERFNYSGDGIELDFSISLSRNNCYVTKNIVIDGKKTTARSLAKFIKE